MIVKFKSPIAMIFGNLIAFIIQASAPIWVALWMGVRSNGEWTIALLITLVVVLLWIRSAFRYLKADKPEKDELGLIPDPRLD